MQTVQANPFLLRSRTQLPETMKPIILENIDTIVKINITNLVGALSFDATSLRFHDQGFHIAHNITPSFIARSLGWVDPNCASHFTEFFDFLGSYISELPQLEVGNKKTPLTKYILQAHENLSMGVRFLAGFYERHLNRKADAAHLAVALNSLECLIAGCALVEGEDSPQYRFNLGMTRLTVQSSFNLFKLDKYLPLKLLFEIPRKNVSSSLLKKKVESFDSKFLGVCLRMKEVKLRDFCSKISAIFHNTERGRGDLFFAELLNDARFSSVHDDCVLKLLRRKKIIRESNPMFENRARRESIKAGVAHVLNRIKELKSQAEPLKLIMEFLDQPVCDYLNFYHPFELIYNFTYHHSDTPIIDNFPGLPLKQLGGYEVRKFVANVLISVDDLMSVDFIQSEGRLILIRAAEFLLKDERNTDKEKLPDWIKSFPEVAQVPTVQAAFAAL